VPHSSLVASRLRHVKNTRSCCSVTVSSTASQASNGTPVQCQQQDTSAAAHDLSVISSHWPVQQQQQQQHNESVQGVAHHVQAEQQQQAVRLHTAAGAAVDACAASQPSGQTCGQTSAWQLLQLQGQGPDKLSVRILACRKPAELMQLTQQIASTGSKRHAARFTVMAALSMATAGSSSSADSSGAEAGSNGDAAVQQLVQQVLQLLTQGSAYYPRPPLACLSSIHLQETLTALQQLVQQSLAVEQQQALQLQLQPVVLQLAEQDVLSGIHACTDVQQLSAVVHWLQACFSVVHVKASLVQLARLCGSSLRHDSSSSSSRGSNSSSSSTVGRNLADRLLQLLHDQQQQQLQPHHAASIVWSLGQLKPLGLQQYNQQLGHQLLHVALGGVGQLNPRVTAMLLHGAARLQLQLQGSDQQQQQQQGSAAVRQLLHNTQQQLSSCDPQAVSGLLWSLAALQQQPGDSWLQQFYHSSWPMLLPKRQQSKQSSGGSSSSNGSSQPAAAQRHANGSSGQQQQGQQPSSSSSSNSSSSSTYNDGWRDSQSSFNAAELTAVLSALVQLQQQPPAAWLTAAVASCHRQLQQFGQQELAVTLWAFAKLQQQLPQQLLAAAVGRVQQLQGGFTPQSTALLLYALTRFEQPQQQQQQLVWQLWQQLQQDSSAGWPPTLEEALQQFQGELHAVAAADVAAVAAAVAAGSVDASSFDAGSSSSSSMQLLFDAVGSQAGDQLQQHNAHDLALLAWSLGKHCWQQQQQNMQQQQLPDAAWLQSYMAAAAQQLQRGRMSSRAMGMTLWGLGTVLHATAQLCGSSSSSNSSSDSVTSSCDDVQTPLANFSSSSSRTLLHSSWSPATAFWTALEQQSAQKLSAFSGDELANLLWGAGQFVRCTHVKPSSEWIDIVACQCLDLMDQLSSYQLVSALQGLVWLQHPRGLSLLQAALSDRCSSRLGTATPQELLLLLRGCVFYRHTPAAAARAALLTAVRRRAKQMPAHQVAQLLYLFGKMQQQHNKRQNQLMLRQLAAAAAAAAGHSPVSSFEEGNSYQQQRSSAAAAPGSTPARISSSSSIGSADARYLPISRQQQQQQMCAIQVERLVPAGELCNLVKHMAGSLQQCAATQVTLVLWGVSQLAPVGLHMQPAAAAAAAARPDGSSSGVSSKGLRSKLSDNSSSAAGACQPSQQQQQQQQEALTSALPFSDCPAGVQLLDELYMYSLRNLQDFSSSEIATVLYAVHKLGVVQPPSNWLAAVVQRAQLLMPAMDGQALAALAVALAGFNWVPSGSWLGAFVEAAAAAEQAGGFKTEWQQQCFSNGLSALDPIAGQMWLQRTRVGSSRSPVIATAAAAAVGVAGDRMPFGATQHPGRARQ
jgi:hypothetical protein